MRPPTLIQTPTAVGLLLALMLAVDASSAAESQESQEWQGSDGELRFELPESAMASGAEQDGEPRVEVRLLLDLASGAERVGVLFRPAPGWHLYWPNPGEVGIATDLRWQADGARVGDIEWPAPERFSDAASGLTSYGYEGEVLLASSLERWSDTASAPEVSVDVRVLVCERACIPATFHLSRTLAPSISAEQVALERAFFDHFREQVPVAPRHLGLTVTSRYSRSSIRPGDGFEAALMLRGCDPIDAACVQPDPASPAIFFSDLEVFDATELSAGENFVAYREGSPYEAGETVDGLLLRLRGELASDVEEPLDRLSGVLSFQTANGESRSISIDLPFPYAQAGANSQELTLPWFEPASAHAADDAGGVEVFQLLQILFFALLGGLLINAMPCVLPVLGIKVCAAAELAQHDSAELRRHGFAYAGGVLSSMAALSAVVLVLQAAGTRVGWGFQFQEPLFVAVVASVVVLFALNLFGLFEIQISTQAINQIGSRSTPIGRSFFDGLLCVVLATPCTAPFLGTAVGFAFAGGPWVIVVVFLAIGVGLAAPYLLISLIPGWASLVPRPGNWMLRLRTGLGFLLMGTAVWLIWIFGQSAGVDGTVRLLALLVMLAFGAWLLGWVQTMALPRANLAATAALVVLSLAGLNTLSVAPSANVAVTPSANGSPASGPYASLPSLPASAPWAPYDQQAIERTLERSQPVFVSFTADWCITCKLNERMTLADARVENALSELGFKTFRADWTQRDEAIRAELARHGRAGVPLYLVYDPRSPGEPVVLPELLRVETVLESLREAAAGLPKAS